MSKRFDWRHLVSCLTAAVVVGGCGATAAPSVPNAKAQPQKAATQTTAAAPAATGKGKQLTSVDLRLAFYMAGYDAPFVLAQSRGYYRDAGLNVKINQGRGSATTAETVGNGSDTFGFADAGTTAKLVSKGVPDVVVAGICATTPLGLIYNPQYPVRSVADLKGRTLMAGAGSAGFQLLPALLKKAGLSVKDVKSDFVSPQAQAATFKANPKFVVIGYNNSSYVTLLQVDPQAKYVSFAKFGVNPYGLALITNRTELKQHPQIVRAFVAATLKGWQAAVKDPNAAIDATLKAYPDMKKNVVATGLKVTFDLLHGPGTAGKPLGWMTQAGWKSTLDLLHTYGGMKVVKPLSAYYTDSFLPKA